MSIYAINLAHFNDRSLVTAMNGVEQNSIILFEDIDCMKSGDARPDSVDAACDGKSKLASMKEDRNGVTLSGLLNALDGFSAPDHVLFVMTSNHIEGLDPALLRPGRIDYRLYLGPATRHQKIELYRRFFPHASRLEAELFVESNDAVKTMAEFQGMLLGLEARNDRGDRVTLRFEESIDITESVA